MTASLQVIGAPNDAFLRETNYRFETFTSWCPQLGGKRVALYGAGANARRILEAESVGFDICAVIDDNAAGESLCSRRIMGTDEALESGIDVVVAASEFKSTLPIAVRLADRCRENGVQLFDMYGNDLMLLLERAEAAVDDAAAGQLALIDSCDALVVSYSLLAAVASEGGSMAISECLRSGTPLERALPAIISYELACKKPVFVYAVDEAVTKEVAAELLDGLGLSGCSFASHDETGFWPVNGLFRTIYDLLPGKRVVHIGSDFMSDCFIPLSYGMDAVLVGDVQLSPSILYGEKQIVHSDSCWYSESTPPLEPAQERLRACTASVMHGLLEKIGDGPADVVSVVAPVVIGFTTWFVNTLESCDGIDGVLFAARDAFIVKQVYDICVNRCSEVSLPSSTYFYTSRISSQNPSLGNLAYFDSCGLGLGKTYAFVEFAGAGTCQKQLEAFAPFRLKGFYFASRIGGLIARGLDACTYLTTHDRDFLARYLSMEPFLSSGEPSLAGFTPDGAPIFAEELRSDEELKFLRDVHAGIELLAGEYFSRWYAPGDVIDHSFINSIVPALDACSTDTMKLYDDLSGRVYSTDPLDESGRNAEDSSADGQEVPSRTIQDVLLGLLGAFDKVCTEHGLTYIATHGTLLGALRHNGFVPWDDDLDIAMPRADYDKLLELAENGAFAEPYFLQTPENDPECFYGGYAKLRDSSTSAIEPSSGGRSFNQGIWMDIMPLDNCPSSEAAVRRRKKIIRTWQRALYAKTYGVHFLWNADPYKLSAYYALGDKLSRESLCKHLRRACSSAKPTGVLTILAGNHLFRNGAVRFAADDVTAAVRVPFANTTIPIPRNSEVWLDRYYGKDWRTIPDQQGEETGHRVSFDPNKSYRDTLGLNEHTTR